MIFPKRLNLIGRHKYVLISLLMYWPALFAATHIPVPDFVGSAGMSDKKLHYLAYLVLVSLLWFVVSPHNKVNWKKAKVWVVLAVIVWYGAIDEWLQGFVHRSPDVADFKADLSGALTGLVILSIFSFWPGLLILFGSIIFIVTNLTTVHVVLGSEHINTAFNFLGYAIFTLIWIQNIHEYFGLRKMGIKWWVAASVVPLLFVAIIRGYGYYFSDKELWIYDIATSVAGILSAIVVSYIACMPKRNAHLKE
jgi:hypothetical protein